MSVVITAAPATKLTSSYGAKAIFAATNFWEQYFADGNDATAAGEKEQAQMYTIASAASKIDSLEHFILLSMPAGEKLAEDLHVPQFDFKDRAADQIIADCPDLIPKTNFLWSGVFTSNFWEGKGFDKPFEVVSASRVCV